MVQISRKVGRIGSPFSFCYIF